MTAAVGAMKALGWITGERTVRRYWSWAGGESIWVQASTGAPSFTAGCQVTVQTKLRTSRSKAGSLEGRSRMRSTVRPSEETFTHNSDGRGDAPASAGTVTNGALTGLGRS